MPKDVLNLETYKELTAGLHKTGLAVQGIAVTQEAHERRLSAVERTVKDDENSLQTRVAKNEATLTRLETKIDEMNATRTGTLQAQIQSRATVAAAWIGLFAGVIAAIAALIIAFK